MAERFQINHRRDRQHARRILAALRRDLSGSSHHEGIGPIITDQPRRLFVLPRVASDRVRH